LGAAALPPQPLDAPIEAFSNSMEQIKEAGPNQCSRNDREQDLGMAEDKGKKNHD